MAIISKAVLYDVYVATELSGNESWAYKISKANADSGYSFGQPQWDLLKRPGSRSLFEDILKTATDDGGNRILTDEEVGTIMANVEKSNGDISSYKDRINMALHSDEGQTEIDSAYDTYLDEKLTRLNNLLGELENSGTRGAAVAANIRDNEILQMLILDYDNKFPGTNGGVDGINSPGNYTTSDDGALMKLLKNGVTTINGKTVKVDGEFDVEDFLEFLFSTKEANKISGSYSGAKDLLRRIDAIRDLAEMKFGLTAEEWKVVDGLMGLYALKLSAKDLLAKIKSLFTTATTTRSPIILDLDGDGVINTLGTDAGIHFDHDGNGFRELSGWVAPGDGVLMLDRDLDDILDNGSELFGNFTPLANGMLAINGFQALAQFDTNEDGKIDANDPIWSQLKVWQHDPEATDAGDPDSSGIFTTLDELGIQSINTGYSNSTTVDEQGNEHKQVGSFTRTDGTINAAEDVYFQVDNMNTIANEWLDVPEDIAALPDLQGYGNVYDLQQAMVRDTSGTLKGLVEQFMNETDSEIRHSLITQILYKWTGVENVDPLSRAATKIYGNVIKNHAKTPLSFLTGDRHDGKCYKERETNIMLRLAA